LQKTNPEAELLDAWFDFVALKQAARPECDLIDKHLSVLANKNERLTELNEIWLEHKTLPYTQNAIPQELVSYFADQQEKLNAKTLEQWQNYLTPSIKTNANWEYVKKPQTGYLVPLMTGYKTISEVFPAGEIDGARDAETELVFAEAVHSIGEWQSVHRLKKEEQWQASVWNYTYEEGWYLCQQRTEKLKVPLTELASDDAYY
jgi:CRISPR-associated protein Csy2